MITYLTGDATVPQGEGLKMLVHICNNIGGWGSGMVVSISARWPEPEQKYREWFKNKENFSLGEIQLVPVSDDIIVVNMIAQSGYSTRTKPAIRYDALKVCLAKVAEKAKELGASVHMPFIGAGLAGGDFDIIKKIIAEELKDLDIFIYSLPK